MYDFKNSNYDLWYSSIDGTNKLRLSNTPESEENPTCSTDDKYIAYYKNNDLYITPTQIFQPKKLLTNVRIPKWVPYKDLILIYSEQTHNNVSFWIESWIVDLEGNIVKKISEGYFTTVDFSPDGKYFVYSLLGNLWIDLL